MDVNKRQSLNKICEDLSVLVKDLSGGDESAIEAVQQKFALLEESLERVTHEVSQIDSLVGPIKSAPRIGKK